MSCVSALRWGVALRIHSLNPRECIYEARTRLYLLAAVKRTVELGGIRAEQECK